MAIEHEHRWTVLETELTDSEPTRALIKCTVTGCGARDTIEDDPVALARAYPDVAYLVAGLLNAGGLRNVDTVWPGDDAILEQAKRRHDAELEQQEAAARAALTERVRAAMETADERDRLVDWDCMADETVVEWDALAAAAVDVFVDYLRNPPVREHQPPALG